MDQLGRARECRDRLRGRGRGRRDRASITPRWEERPILLVVRKPGSTVTPDAIQAHLAQHVAKWWLPDEIHFVDNLPHTATGKLLKTAIREQYKDFRLAAA